MCLRCTCLFLNSTLWQRMLNQVLLCTLKKTQEKKLRVRITIFEMPTVLGPSHILFVIFTKTLQVKYHYNPIFQMSYMKPQLLQWISHNHASSAELFSFLLYQVFRLPMSDVLELHKFILLSFERNILYC